MCSGVYRKANGVSVSVNICGSGLVVYDPHLPEDFSHSAYPGDLYSLLFYNNPACKQKIEPGIDIAFLYDQFSVIIFPYLAQTKNFRKVARFKMFKCRDAHKFLYVLDVVLEIF